MRKPIFRVSDQVRHKLYNYSRWLEAQNFGFRKKRNRTIYVAKTKPLISCTVTVKQIYTFVFAYAEGRFSHDWAHMFLPVLVR